MSPACSRPCRRSGPARRTVPSTTTITGAGSLPATSAVSTTRSPRSHSLRAPRASAATTAALSHGQSSTASANDSRQVSRGTPNRARNRRAGSRAASASSRVTRAADTGVPAGPDTRMDGASTPAPARSATPPDVASGLCTPSDAAPAVTVPRTVSAAPGDVASAGRNASVTRRPARASPLQPGPGTPRTQALDTTSTTRAPAPARAANSTVKPGPVPAGAGAGWPAGAQRQAQPVPSAGAMQAATATPGARGIRPTPSGATARWVSKKRGPSIEGRQSADTGAASRRRTVAQSRPASATSCAMAARTWLAAARCSNTRLRWTNTTAMASAAYSSTTTASATAPRCAGWRRAARRTLLCGVVMAWGTGR